MLVYETHRLIMTCMNMYVHLIIPTIIGSHIYSLITFIARVTCKCVLTFGNLIHRHVF